MMTEQKVCVPLATHVTESVRGDTLGLGCRGQSLGALREMGRSQAQEVRCLDDLKNEQKNIVLDVHVKIE